MNPVDQILHVFAARGSSAYVGEPVSQLEHALQTAALAAEAGAAEPLIAAALLHDIGHLLVDDEHAADQGHDTQHEAAGHAWLQRYFGPAVSEPVRLHVEAKRYLCTRDERYRAALSEASQKSLELQGGRLSPAALEAFEAEPFHQDSVRLRRWDDQAKTRGKRVPALETYVDALRRVAVNQL